MPRDTQIFLGASRAGNSDYELPKSSEIVVEAVTATFTDNGAAADWCPAVVMISDSGHTIARAMLPDVKVTAGGSAEASFFPGVKPGAAAGPSPSAAGLAVAAAYSDPSGVTVVSGALNTYVSLQDGVSNAGFATTDSTAFANLSSTSFTGAAVYGIGIKTAGTYAVFNNSFDIGGGTAGRVVTAYWAASNGSAPSFFQQGRSQNLNVETWDRGQAGQGPHMFLHEWITVTSGQTPAVLVPYGKVASGGNITMSFQMMVVQLTTNVLAKL